MDTRLQLDHHWIEASESPNGMPGVVVRALLTLSGEAPHQAARPPIGLSFVIDRSGSMQGARIEAARMAAARAVDRLHPDDVVSVVAFDDVIENVAAPDRRARHHQLALHLHAIDARGSTNLSGGWLRGREHMQHALGMIGALPGSTRRIVLLSDGHANMGITDPSTLVELARTARAMGISTSTVGIGDGYDDALLRAMADAGGGNAWYIERPDQSHDVLAEELGNLLAVCAQGITVTLACEQAVSVVVMHSDWPGTASSAGTFTFDLGDLYAAEPKPLLFELFVPVERLEALRASGDAIAALSVSGSVLTPGGGVEARTVTLPIASTLEGQRHVEPEVEMAVLLARAAKAREAAARYQRDGDADMAAHAMEASSASLRTAEILGHPAYSAAVIAEADELEALARKYRAREHGEQDAKYQLQRTYNRRRGKQAYDETLRRKAEE